MFHLAAVVSGMAEADFALGMRINVDASRLILEACRHAGHGPRLVFASSVAVYGGAPSDTMRDSTAPTPRTSYGTQKAMVELLINDYSRRGFVDGRVLRLPTISVRPGRPNAAASSFASGIIREPLNGEPAVCPVDPETTLAAAVAVRRRRLHDPRPRFPGRRVRRQPGREPARPLRDGPRDGSLARACGRPRGGQPHPVGARTHASRSSSRTGPARGTTHEHWRWDFRAIRASRTPSGSTWRSTLIEDLRSAIEDCIGQLRLVDC